MRTRTPVRGAFFALVSILFLRAPSVSALDHFQCYKVKSNPITHATVTFDNPYSPGSSASVSKLDTLCNPVDKNGEGIDDPTGHLTCYKAKAGKPTMAVAPGLATQFGALPGGPLLKLSRVCVHAIINGVPSVGPLGDYACYKVKPQFSGPVPATLGLSDEFGSAQVETMKVDSFCVPSAVNASPVNDSATHLVCYKLKASKVTTSVPTSDAIAPNVVTTSKPQVLCVPTEGTPPNTVTTTTTTTTLPGTPCGPGGAPTCTGTCPPGQACQWTGNETSPVSFCGCVSTTAMCEYQQLGYCPDGFCMTDFLDTGGCWYPPFCDGMVDQLPYYPNYPYATCGGNCWDGTICSYYDLNTSDCFCRPRCLSPGLFGTNCLGAPGESCVQVCSAAGLTYSDSLTALIDTAEECNGLLNAFHVQGPAVTPLPGCADSPIESRLGCYIAGAVLDAPTRRFVCTPSQGTGSQPYIARLCVCH